MPDGPVSVAGRRALRSSSGARTLLPADVADLLLDGDPSPHPVTSVLMAARRPATVHELRGEAAARQAFVDALPLATPVPLSVARERRGRHRRMRAVRTVVTAKVIGVAALTLTAGGVAVAATGPSGAPAEERISGGAVPSADAEPGTDHTTAGRAPGAGHTAASPGRDTACGPVTGAAIADLARECDAPPADAPPAGDGEHRVGPGAMAFGTPYALRDAGPSSPGDRNPDLAAPPGTPPTVSPTAPPTSPPTAAPPTAGPPTSVPPASGPPAQADGNPGTGPGSPDTAQGAAPSGSGPRGQEHDTRDDTPPGRGESAADSRSTPAGDARTPVTGRGAPASP